MRTDGQAAAPARGVLDGRGDHPVPDLADQTAILGDWQEGLRRRVSPVRQPPAQERFHDADLTGREVDFRLEVKLEFLALDRPAKALLGREPRRGRLEQLGAEQAHSATPLRLRVEERRVRGAQQPFRLATVRREDAGAEAEAHQELAIVDEERLLERAHDLLGRRLDAGHVAAGDADDGEFVAAEAGAVAELAHGLPEPVGHGLQHAVAEDVAHAVVDRLEVVEVEEEDAGERSALGGLGQRLVQLHQELPAVRQAGQRVVRGEVLQLAGALLDLRLELAVVLAGELVGGGQAFGHQVE
jgi:hypothetical protein